MESNRYFKKRKSDKIWWIAGDQEGEMEFTFDKKQIFNLFADYPWKLTAEQKEIFDKENPFWADFFADRNEEYKHKDEWNDDIK